MAEWQPYLILAAVGAFLILIGIAFMGVQLVVSVRHRQENRDLTGDPWNGRTLEWLTSSPPAPYNFAVIPQIHGRDAFLDMKERGVAYRRPERYEDILMPKNSAFGIVVGALAFAMGFAMVWHIWWAAVGLALLIAIAVVIRSSIDDTEYRLPASKIEEIETRRYQEMANAPRWEGLGDEIPFPPEPLPGSAS